MTKMKDFSVDRTKWVRGRRREFGATGLLNRQGNLCCLGHYCQQLGVPDVYLYGRGNPAPAAEDAAEDGDYEIPGLVQWHGGRAHATLLTRCAVRVNDDPSISDAERERELSALFASHGIKVEFYG